MKKEAQLIIFYDKVGAVLGEFYLFSGSSARDREQIAVDKGITGWSHYGIRNSFANSFYGMTRSGDRWVDINVKTGLIIEGSERIIPEEDLDREKRDLSFERAFQALKIGRIITRNVRWEGEIATPFFLYLIPEGKHALSEISNKDVVGLIIKEFQPKENIFSVSPSIVMITDEGIITNGWTPTQEDLFAKDWRILE